MRSIKNIKNARISIDERGDAIWFVLKRGEESEVIELAPGINVELDNSKNLIGIEIMNFSRLSSSSISDIKDVSIEIKNKPSEQFDYSSMKQFSPVYN